MGLVQVSDDFENRGKDWFFTGGAGLDFGKGVARRGDGNGWVRNTTGWNAINICWPVWPNLNYSATAWLRLSPDVTDGYFSVRNDKEGRLDGNSDVINEVKLVGPGPENAENSNYNQYSFDFASGINNRILLYVGLWGNGKDAWIQVDEVSITGFTNT